MYHQTDIEACERYCESNFSGVDGRVLVFLTNHLGPRRCQGDSQDNHVASPATSKKADDVFFA